MFSEELEIDPPPSGVNSPYRSRLARLIAGGLALARFDDDGRVLFKAEIAAVSPAVLPGARACGSTRPTATRASAPRAWPP